MRSLLLPVLATLLLSALLVRVLLSEKLARLVLDVPNERSLHDRPIPRTGGIGLMIAATCAWWLSGAMTWGSMGTAPIVLIAGLLAVLFLGDDVRNLSVPVRFGAQFLAAGALIAASWPYPGWLAPLLLVGIVWSMNLYNFMDGSNGLAGGMAMIGFGALAIAAEAAGARDLALVAAIVAAAAVGFLVWNFDPARIFLGDAGSIPLGFLAVSIGLIGWNRGLWPFWFPALVFATFIVDSGLTLAKRIVHRENPLQAHRSHYYQRLIRMGWSHRRLALTAYGLMTATAASALAFRTAPVAQATLVLGGWGIAFLGLALLVDHRWRASPVRGK